MDAYAGSRFPADYAGVGALGPILGSIRAHLEPFFILFGAHLGPFWAHLGPIGFWAHLGLRCYPRLGGLLYLRVVHCRFLWSASNCLQNLALQTTPPKCCLHVARSR